MKSIYIAGEDDVTKACLKKIIYYCDPETKIITDLPGRGGQIKSSISKFNKLSEDFPVILLMDLDNNICPPLLKEKCFEGISKSANFIFNIACDEAEAWLMSDKKTFSHYFKVPINLLPDRKNIGTAMNPYHELDFKYKSSLYLTKELIKSSNEASFVKMMTPKNGASKGPEYNLAIMPYILDHWNLEDARLNSDSLDKAIKRIANFL